MPDGEYLSPIEEVLEEARNGRMVILVDEEDRENEGDLVIPAQMAGPEVVNFMATHGRGLICLALTPERVAELDIPPMNADNRTRLQTAFTVSVEAREGVTTGISAADRAHTIAVAIDPSKGAADIVSPGHVFPLVAREGGVLVRAGHTEAAVDIARLAGLNPSGVICEIMNEDGTMARLPDLVKFAQFHGLKVGTIATLIAYRLNNDRLVKRAAETEIESAEGDTFKMIVYQNSVEEAEYLALVKGDISGPEPVLVRMHTFNVFEDILGVAGRRTQMRSALQKISKEGLGVAVLIRDHKPGWIADQIQQRQNGQETPPELRHYGIGAQILRDLGVRDMILLSNTKRTIVGLDGYGLKVVDQRGLDDG